jgi:hypothetical protein
MVSYTSVDLSTIRVDVFNNISTLIDDNKLTGWTILSSFPEDNPIFPCIVINPALIRTKMLTLDRSKHRRNISVEVGFYVEAKDRLSTLDKGRDNFHNTLMNNHSTLRTYGLVLDMNSPFTDSEVTTQLFNEHKLHTATSIINLKLA